MRQLLKNQFENVCWVIMICLFIIVIFIFPSCVAKNDQSFQDVSNKSLQENKVDEKIDANSAIMEKQANKKRVIKAVKLLQKPSSLEVMIVGNKELKYTSIKQSFPFGIAIYLPDTKLGEKITSIVSETGSISNIISSYADKDKKTAKIEILLNSDLPYDIKKESDNLIVTISSENRIAQSDATITETLKKNNKNSNSKLIKIPNGVANIADIEFSVEDEGYTELKLTTSHPIRYDFSKGNQGTLYLNLYKTNIPLRHNRPFETKYFRSAVYKILPIQNKKNSRIEISMREKVPYQVVQNNNTITVRFEPSSIEPPKFTKAEKTESNKLASEVEAKPLQREIISQAPDNQKTDSDSPNLIDDNDNKISKSLISPPKQQSIVKISSNNKNLSRQKPTYNTISDEEEYTGEKIKLDFYETDIKNVFRILSSIGNKNFAIDKDVIGSVTLTLDNPIPWDQVLDLILSMNQLGKIHKGNVIRIATQGTLAAEAEQQHAKFQAMQKAKAAKKALQPMTTEYIPINYANAALDIMPHIKQILTPERGTVSVDQRTNMVIITDTREVVNRAKELIYTLDNVTPQIMISAKIVEANKEFSRDFGLGLNFGFNEGVTVPVNDNYNVSINSPATASNPANIASFTFNNLVGAAFGDGGASFLTATLNASESKGDITVLSSPKILTLDNKKAIIKQGLEYPYTVVDEDGKVSVEFKDIDLRLEVTPHVTPDKRISMEIFVTKNEIAGEFVLGVPPVSTNEATTTLLVNNNDTIVIGGVLKSFRKEDKSGFPFLMNIPLIGRLFRTDTSEDNKQELLIFLTPTIVQLKQIKHESTDSRNQMID